MKLLFPIEFDESNIHEWKNTLSAVARMALNFNISRQEFLIIAFTVDEPYQQFLIGRYDFLKAEKERNRNRNAARKAGTTKPKPNQPRNDITRVHGYERLAIVPLETVFTNMGKIIKVEGKEIAKGEGIAKREEVAIRSRRYKCYSRKGVKCVRCGIEGHYFAVERSKNCPPNTRYHLNLYHLSEDKREIMLTVDHRCPKSRGGADSIENLQPMCAPCNFAKGNMTEEEFEKIPLVPIILSV